MGEVIDSDLDASDGAAIALNYSKEDVAALVDEAEKLVMSRKTSGKLRSSSSQQSYHHHYDCSSDSDYETKVSRDWMVQSEPNINLRRGSPSSSTAQSAATRRRKSGTASRRDWRHSLPECLEYFNHCDGNDEDSDDGRNSEASLPLSDLWEHDQFVSEIHQDPEVNPKATLPENLENFGDDYSAYLYSDTDTASELFTDEDDDRVSRQTNINYKILQSKSCLQTFFIHLNSNSNDDKSLDEFEEVCKKNIAVLSDQLHQLENKQQIKSVKRLISKWESLKIKIRNEMEQKKELENITKSINNVVGDLETLDSIILDDDEEDDMLEEDCEVADMRHQLYEQVKSHLLEISDTLFQLNMSLHNAKSSLTSPHSLQVSEVEAKLRMVYSRWQDTHQHLSQAENRHQRDQFYRQQGEFCNILSDKLSRVARTEEFVNSNTDTKDCDNANKAGENGDDSPGWWWRRLIKYSLVSGLVMVSMISSSYLWSYNKCQHGYYSSVWPMISFSSVGPRPY